MLNRKRIVIAVLLCGFLLWFLFRATDWRALLTSLTAIDPAWLAVAFVLSFSSFVVRAQRWSYVVRATHPASFRNLFSATQIGMLVNCLVPARIGDVVRGYVLASMEKISFAQSLSLVGLDRINDILALLAVLVLALLSFPSHADIQFSAGAFGNPEPFIVSSALIRPVTLSLATALTVVIGILLLLHYQQNLVLRAIDKTVEPLLAKAAAGLRSLFLNFAAGMQVFRSPGQMARAVLLSLVTWGLVALSIAALLHAFHLNFPWYGPVLVLAILGVFTSVTVTPGLVGQYHVPVVASLLMMLPGMDVNQAKAIAIVAHLIAVVPPVVLGVCSMLGAQLGFSDLIPQRETKADIMSD